MTLLMTLRLAPPPFELSPAVFIDRRAFSNYGLRYKDRPVEQDLRLEAKEPLPQTSSGAVL
jgi:hypothetical protein